MERRKMASKEESKAKTSRKIFIPMADSVFSYIIGKFDDMEHFREFTISAIENEKKKVQEWFAKYTKGKSEEEIEIDMDLASDEYFMVEDVFSTISLNSFVIILYSYIEGGLNFFSDTLYSDQRGKCKVYGGNPIQIRYTDMKGKGIERAKICFEKVFGVDIHAGKQPWQEIKALQKIRNTIVHEEGWASDDMLKDQCIKDCMKKRKIEIERRRDGSLGKVIVKPGYLDRILEQAKLFFSNVEWKS
jgi:hypothetical protein